MRQKKWQERSRNWGAGRKRTIQRLCRGGRRRSGRGGEKARGRGGASTYAAGRTGHARLPSKWRKTRGWTTLFTTGSAKKELGGKLPGKRIVSGGGRDGNGGRRDKQRFLRTTNKSEQSEANLGSMRAEEGHKNQGKGKKGH